MCNIEEHINKFYKKYSECKDCNIKKGVKLYYNNKDKKSIQENFFLKNVETNFYRNKVITGIKETQNIRNFLEPILNWKID